MTMKDRHILQKTLEGCARVQARGDYMAKRLTKARSKKQAEGVGDETSKAHTKMTKDMVIALHNDKDSNDKEKGKLDLTDPQWRFEERVNNLVAKGNTQEEAEATVRRVIEKKELDPLPVVKGTTGPLGNLVLGQKFFVPGTVGDFVLENWKLAPGIFDDKGDLRKCPVVRQITQRRTASKEEVTLRPVLMNAWFEETQVTVVEDFALQTAKDGVQSIQAQNEQGDKTMAAKKKSAKKATNGEAKTAKSYVVNASKIDEKLQKQLDNEEKNSHGVVVLRFCKSVRKALSLDEIIAGVKATRKYKTEGTPDGLIAGDVRILTEKGILTAKEA